MKQQKVPSPPSPPPTTLPELSPLAKSVRDRVRHLVDHTTAAARIGTEQQHYSVVIPVVVAVSGGCDSVALFHALLEWNAHLQLHQHKGEDKFGDLEIDITVVHFHHRQRPVEADRDCALVQELVTSHNNNTTTQTTPIAFLLEDWKDQVDDSKHRNNPSASSSTMVPSFSQDAARRWRRQRLHHHAQKRVTSIRTENNRSVPFGIVLTAHHDDDSYETVLIKLLRGVHLLNLHDKSTIATIALMKEDHEVEGEVFSSGRMQPVEADTINDGATASQLPGSNGLHEGETNTEIYLVRPFVASATNTITQPPLWRGHTKDDLVEYLISRDLRWREDASNHDPNSKYLRNRVRNELIPLLKDLTDDSFRTKRIPALLAQSLEVRRDLEPRVDDYQTQVTTTLSSSPSSDNEKNPVFVILPHSEDSVMSCGTSSSQLVRSQALYRWMTACVQRDSGAADAALASPDSNGSISYECLQRVVQQIENHPHRKQWTLEVGSNWNLRRVGDILTMTRGSSKSNDHNPGDHHRKMDNDSSGRTVNSITTASNERMWTWTRGLKCCETVTDTTALNDDSERSEDRHHVAIKVPSIWLEEHSSPAKTSSLEFLSVLLRDAEADWHSQQRQPTDDTTTTRASTVGADHPSPLRFVPPWRTSPRKLRAFLRGQKVPVHERDTTPLLLARRTTMAGQVATIANILVAVCIRGNWTVNKEFYLGEPPHNGAMAHHDTVDTSKAIVTIHAEQDQSVW